MGAKPLAAAQIQEVVVKIKAQLDLLAKVERPLSVGLAVVVDSMAVVQEHHIGGAVVVVVAHLIAAAMSCCKTNRVSMPVMVLLTLLESLHLNPVVLLVSIQTTRCVVRVALAIFQKLGLTSAVHAMQAPSAAPLKQHLLPPVSPAQPAGSLSTWHLQVAAHVQQGHTLQQV